MAKDPEINWGIKVDEEGVVNFLCKEKGFSEKRVRGGLNSLRQVRLRVQASGFDAGKSTSGKIEGLGSRVQGSGFRVQGSGFDAVKSTNNRRLLILIRKNGR